MNKGGRTVVAEMSVVDEHHQRTPPGCLDHGPAVASQQLREFLPGKSLAARVGGRIDNKAPKGHPRDA